MDLNIQNFRIPGQLGFTVTEREGCVFFLRIKPLKYSHNSILHHTPYLIAMIIEVPL